MTYRILDMDMNIIYAGLPLEYAQELIASLYCQGLITIYVAEV